VAARYTESLYEDMDAIGIERPDIEPKATEHIEDMIKTINTLIEKGHAYVSGGDVYFDVRKFEGYGRLSNQDLDEMLEGARIEAAEKKKDPLDFALWKAAKETSRNGFTLGTGAARLHIRMLCYVHKNTSVTGLTYTAAGATLYFRIMRTR